MNWLSERRKALNISQEDLVTLLREFDIEVSRSSVSHWESGRYNVPLDDSRFRRALANALKMTIPEMLTLAGYEIDHEYSSDAMRAADIVEQLEQGQRLLALGILEQFLRTE